MSEDKRANEIPRHRSTKNRKRWCRGKEGREHKPVCRKYAEVKRDYLSTRWPDRVRAWRVLVCEACGKELDMYVGNRTGRPDWVQ